jgi:thioredoxin-dependent peroxiredoxin
MASCNLPATLSPWRKTRHKRLFSGRTPEGRTRKFFMSENLLKAGDPAPDFDLPTAGGGRVSLAGLKGKRVILYFYPKDDTPACTEEARNFTEKTAEFKALGAAVLGVSRDSVAKHDKFVAKYGLKLPLASDEGGEICQAYGVWVEKTLYGRTYMGVERATFLIGPDGRIAHVWRKVRVKGHVEAVLRLLKGK